MKKLIAVIACGLIFAANLSAETNQTNQAVKNGTKALSQAEQPKVFDIDFEGGTPEELVKRIGEASGSRPNVIIPSHLKDLKISKFDLRKVTEAQVFEALNMVTDESGERKSMWMGDGDKGDLHQIWTLTKAPQRANAQQCQVTFIGFLLDNYTIDDINTAIRSSWEMQSDSTTASVKFHKETKLLISKGSATELKLAQDVLIALERGAVAKQSPKPASKNVTN